VEAAGGAGGARRGHLPGRRGRGSRRRWKAACSAAEDGVAGVCWGVVRGEGVAGDGRGAMACAEEVGGVTTREHGDRRRRGCAGKTEGAGN
jgi:hypothetical protein